jgi:hypothetical protein
VNPYKVFVIALVVAVAIVAFNFVIHISSSAMSSDSDIGVVAGMLGIILIVAIAAAIGSVILKWTRKKIEEKGK